MGPKIFLSEAEKNAALNGGRKTRSSVVKSSASKAVQKIRREPPQQRIIQPFDKVFTRPNSTVGKGAQKGKSTGTPRRTVIDGPNPRANGKRQQSGVILHTSQHQQQPIVKSVVRPVIKNSTAPLSTAQAGNNNNKPRNDYSNNNRVVDITMARETAAAIARNNGHPNNREVLELLRCQEKGWVTNEKFIEALQKLLY